MTTEEKPKASKLRVTPPSFSTFKDDCSRPACDDMTSMMKQAQERSSHTAANKGTAVAASQTPSVECPPNSAFLGRLSWTLLHSMAAWYPDQPNDQDKKHMTNFMSALARFYPCPWCATDFQANIEQKPVQTSSRKDLCTWLCEQHNVVNEKLGKPVYSCDMESLDERWRKSSKEQCRSKPH